MLEKYGSIVSLKICLNGDHTSKGFGYVTFEEEKAAMAAVETGAHIDSDQVVATPYKRDVAAANEAEDHQSLA